MKLVYKIEVYMEESDVELEEPYFWRLASKNADSTASNWCTSSAGYGRTYQDAFNQALYVYETYKRGAAND